MAFKAYIGCCCCCKKRSKPYIQSCSIFFLVMAAIKLINFLVLVLYYGVNDAVTAILAIMIIFEAAVLVFAILLLCKNKKPNFKLVKIVGIITVIIFALEAIMYIALCAMYGSHVTAAAEEVANQHGEGAGVITAVFGYFIIIPIIIELSIFWGFVIWQVHAAAALIKCGNYNLNKIEKGEEESPSSTDSDKERKRRKKERKNQRQNQQYQGAYNQYSQPIQYANRSPAQGQPPYPVQNPQNPGYQPPPPGYNQPPPGYNPNYQYNQPPVGFNQANPPNAGPLYGTHANNPNPVNPPRQEPPKEDPNAI